jgi:hypothetical protein
VTDRLIHVYKGTPGDHCVCDQALRILPSGQWVIVFMTGGDHEPRKENYIALVRSDDEGATWSRLEVVLQLEDRGCLLSEVTVIDGEITIYGHDHEGFFEDWRCFTIRSIDEGKTWSARETFGPLPRRTFTRNLYQSTWGTRYLPFQTYDVTDDPGLSHLKDGSFEKGMNGVLISEDHGRSWTRSELIGPQKGWNENNLVESSDGRLMMLCRADGTGRLSYSESRDRGQTWSGWADADIPNPGTKFRLHRLSDGRIVLIHNPNGIRGVRNPLAIWVSEDDMVSWPHRRTITDFPGQLSYPDGVVSADETHVHFAFDYNRHDLIAVSSVIPQ